MTGGNVIMDTNVLVYAADGSEPEKKRQARRALARIVASRRGVLPAQVLGEYFNVISRKPRFGQNPVNAAMRVAEYRRDFAVLDTTADVVEEAARGVCAYGFSYYDAQIWATARLAGIEVILTEDFEDGRVVEGVLFIDPFKPKFDIERLLGE